MGYSSGDGLFKKLTWKRGNMYGENGGDEGEDVVTPDGKLRDITWTEFGVNLCTNSAIEKSGGRCQPRKKSL
jgi:hypothetical protein